MGRASALAAIGVVFVNQDEKMTRFMLDHQFKAVIVPRVRMDRRAGGPTAGYKGAIYGGCKPLGVRVESASCK